jgi:hypothetical protein
LSFNSVSATGINCVLSAFWATLAATMPAMSRIWRSLLATTGASSVLTALA